MSFKDVLVVVPAYNESASIGRVVRALLDLQVQVLVVDDGSSDDTASIARREGARVLQLAVNLGVGSALRAGFRYAVRNGFTMVVQVDADGQHPIDELENLINSAYLHDAHLLIGSRYLSAADNFPASAPRRLAHRVLGSIATRIAGSPISDATSGFRAIRQPLLTVFAEQFPSYYLGDTFEATVSAARAGYRIHQVPIKMQLRRHGTSSATTIRAITLTAKVVLIAILRLHQDLPRRR